MSPCPKGDINMKKVLLLIMFMAFAITGCKVTTVSDGGVYEPIKEYCTYHNTHESYKCWWRRGDPDPNQAKEWCSHHSRYETSKCSWRLGHTEPIGDWCTYHKMHEVTKCWKRRGLPDPHQTNVWCSYHKMYETSTCWWRRGGSNPTPNPTGVWCAHHKRYETSNCWWRSNPSYRCKYCKQWHREKDCHIPCRRYGNHQHHGCTWCPHHSAYEKARCKWRTNNHYQPPIVQPSKCIYCKKRHHLRECHIPCRRRGKHKRHNCTWCPHHKIHESSSCRWRQRNNYQPPVHHKPRKRILGHFKKCPKLVFRHGRYVVLKKKVCTCKY